METTDYDLVIIGAGPAGTPVAMEYAKLDSSKKVALIDSLGELGGECLFQGCIPSKIMEASAKAIQELDSLKAFGVAIDNSHHKLVWEKIKERKESILNRRTTAAKEVAQGIANIEIIKAWASFEDEHHLKLSFGKGEEKIISFERALIATGSKANIASYQGNATDEIITNDEFFAKMELPQSLTIIGSGAIAIEFAQILSALGVEINLLVRGEKIVKNIDDEASNFLLKKLSQEMNVLLNAELKELNHHDKGLELSYTQAGEKKTLVCDKVLSAIGRSPNITQLHLEKAKVAFTKKGVVTTKAMQTSTKNIFANGDVVENFPKFAHTAQYAAHIIAQNLFLEHNFFSPDFSKNSWVLFSMPNVASAGISQAEAEEKNIEVIVDKFDFSTEAKSQIENEDFGYLKFVVDKKSHKILGISILHNEANMIAGEAALIVSEGLTLKALINSIHPHPTMSEAFVMLAKKMMGDIMLEKLDNKVVQMLLRVKRFL